MILRLPSTHILRCEAYSAKIVSSQSQRGVLNLESQRDSWLANSSELPPVEPYIRDFANMGGPQDSGNIALHYGVGKVPAPKPFCRICLFLRQIRPLYSCSRRLSPTEAASHSLCNRSIRYWQAWHIMTSWDNSTTLVCPMYQTLSPSTLLYVGVDGLQQSLLYLSTSCLRSSYVLSFGCAACTRVLVKHGRHFHKL